MVSVRGFIPRDRSRRRWSHHQETDDTKGHKGTRGHQHTIQRTNHCSPPSSAFGSRPQAWHAVAMQCGVELLVSNSRKNHVWRRRQKYQPRRRQTRQEFVFWEFILVQSTRTQPKATDRRRQKRRFALIPTRRKKSFWPLGAQSTTHPPPLARGRSRGPHQRGPNQSCGGLWWVAVGCGGLRWVAVGFSGF